MSGSQSKNHNIIETENLGFRYPGSSGFVLNNLRFSVKPGEIYGFLGPSGAGKSTTQKILYRLLTNYSGSVKILGKEVRDWGTSVYDSMGIGFETPNVYSKLSGRENLEFALSLRFPNQGDPNLRGFRKSIDTAAERMGLSNFLDKRVQTYSKGMKMRLGFIRAVIHEPEIVFLDEPTSGLDPLWARVVKDWILELKSRGAGIFVTTHSMELADELCDRVGFLVDGSLVTQGNPEALKKEFGKGGVIIRGTGINGTPRDMELSYQDMSQDRFPEFSAIQRVENQEVSLEQVFIKLTGRNLGTT